MGKGSASVGQIWESSKAYMGSNTLKRYDGVIHQETVKNLGSFLQTKGLFDVGIDNETRADDRLQKYNIMQFSPTKHLDEMHNMGEVYLITDEQGHDIGTYTVDENGHGVFKLSPKIEEMNRKIIEKMETEKEREFLRDKYDINSMEDLAEKLAKGEEVALSSKEQGKAEFKEHELAQYGEDFETEDSQDPEDAKEQEEIKALPSDMRAEVLQMCHDKNIKVTEIMIVQDCRDVYKEMGDGPRTVSPTGGPVIMVRAAGVTDDKLFMFQKGQLLPNTDPQKDRMLEIMYQHKGSQNLADFEDHREDGVLDQMLEAVAEYEQEMANYEKSQFESEEERLQCIDAAKSRLGKSLDSATEDYTPDSDGDVACLSRAIEEEVDQDSRDEVIERKMEEHEGEEHDGEEHDGDDDTELSRWDKADPYQSNKRF